jgi:predicted GNAT family N-acyltransferase
MSYQVRRIPGAGTLEDAFAVRRAVFIEEQDVDEEIEMDGRDGHATHFVIVDTTSETAVGTARLRTTDDDTAKPERVAVRQAYRGDGLGQRLMGLIESEARTQGCQRSVLHAQTQVVGFYRALGYEVTSEEFEEAGITHVEMEKQL